MIYGYARVSTVTQGRDGNSLEDQVSALEKYGCQEIITEAFSGKTMERPKFNSLFRSLQRDDTFLQKFCQFIFAISFYGLFIHLDCSHFERRNIPFSHQKM